jgi:hypothetical protein
MNTPKMHEKLFSDNNSNKKPASKNNNIIPTT